MTFGRTPPYSTVKKVATFGKTRKSVPVTYAGDCCIGRVTKLEGGGYKFVPNEHGREMRYVEVVGKTVAEIKRYLNDKGV